MTLVKSLAGHMVAGTAEPEEVIQFSQLMNDLEQGKDSNKTLQAGASRVGDRVETPKGTLFGTIVRINADGAIVWKCDQTGAVMTGTPHSLKSYPSA